MDQKLDETPKARAETRAFLLINRLLGRHSALAPPLIVQKMLPIPFILSRIAKYCRLSMEGYLKRRRWATKHSTGLGHY
jgi:hypothetical protein